MWFSSPPDELFSENLRKKGALDKKIKFIGNIVIDTLEENRKITEELFVNDIIKRNFIQDAKKPTEIKNDYAVMILHRSSNVDSKKVLEPLKSFILNEET